MLRRWRSLMHEARFVQVALGAGAVVFAGTVAYSCGASNPTMQSPQATSWADGSAPGRAVTAPTSPVIAAASSAPVELTQFTPLLALPELVNVGEAVDADKPDVAYKRYQLALSGPLSEARQEPQYQFQLGRLASDAGVNADAVQAFSACAASAWELSEYCAYFAARAEVRSGASPSALSRLTAFEPRIAPLHDWWLTLEGEAALGGAEPRRAAEALRQALEQAPNAPDRSRRALLYAQAVISQAAGKAQTPPGPAAVPPSGAAPRQQLSETDVLSALRWVRRAALEAAGSTRATEASQLETQLLALLSPETFRANQALTADDQLVRVNALVDRRKFADARVAADELFKTLAPSDAYTATACEARLLDNKARAGLKEWGQATDALAQLAGRCQDLDLRARALYLAGKYARYDKRWSQSARLFKQLEDEAPQHRLADDARLLRAEAYLELSDTAEYTRLLSTFAEDYPDGDMVLDGVSDLALRLMTKGEWGQAANVLERGTTLAKRADRVRDHEYAGRERYFLARAWIRSGEQERGLNEFEALIKERPLSYYMQHAYSRLYEIDPERANRARDEAMQAAQLQPFRFDGRPEFETPAFHRVLELLRQGQLDWASRELDELVPGGASPAPEMLWATALLFARAGSASLSHELARGQLTDWLNQWPAGEWRQAWELAFPRPYSKFAEKEAQRNALSPALVYAVMREESGFDAKAHSHADAYGLMQLIEPTARHFAKELKLPISGNSLFNPRINIALGARTLGSYCDRFPDNRLLGIPSYNAGPGRPKRWLKELPSQDFDVWVELIPFRETRRYTKRVLASYGVYTFLYEKNDEPWLLPTRVQ